MISTCGLPLVHSHSLQMWRNVATALPKLSKTESLEEGEKKNRKDAASVDASANDESSVIILQLVRESVA